MAPVRSRTSGIVLFLVVAAAARAPAGQDDCRARLKQMDATLAARRAAVRGWIRPVPNLAGFEIAKLAAVEPLEFTGMFAEVSESDLWLDGQPIPGTDRASQLKELAARIAKIWSNYALLYPKGPPPRRQMYVVFDKWVMAKDAIQTIAVIGRDDALIPIAAPERWAPAVPAGPALDARMRSIRAEVDAVSAATKWVNLSGLLEHALGSCRGKSPVIPPRSGPTETRSEDELREALHAHVIGLLKACDCRGANVDAVENVLLDDAGGFIRPLQRLPLRLKAVGGEPLEVDPDARIMEVLAGRAAHPGAATRPLTLRLRGPRK